VSLQQETTAAAKAQEKTCAYAVLARSYNEIMDHVDYPAWARYLESLFARHHIVPSSLLEVASGTCYLASLLDLGSQCRRVHSDLSLPMLQQALARLPWDRLVCDMRQLPFGAGSFDLLLCLYDAFNYLTDPAEAATFFC